jgi:hypothetical protein
LWIWLSRVQIPLATPIFSLGEWKKNKKYCRAESRKAGEGGPESNFTSGGIQLYSPTDEFASTHPDVSAQRYFVFQRNIT